MPATVAALYRYPVKGLDAEALERVALTPGQGLPHDRRFAIAHGSTRFEASDPQWQPKTNFLMLMRDEKLAQLRSRFDPETGFLAITRDGKQVVRAKITEPLGKTLIGQFFAGFMAGAARGALKLVEAQGHMFSDSRHKVVSLINLATVRDLERVVRKPVDPLRFRANVYFDGVPAWSELDWVGGEIGLGAARGKVVAPIGRCAATNVNPATAQRNLNIPLELQRGFGHENLGLYVEITAGGTLAKGDALTPPA